MGDGGEGSRDAVRAFDPEASFQLLADPVAQWLDWEEQANLIGFPFRIALGEKSMAKGEVEIKPRAGKLEAVKIEQAIERVMQLIAEACAA